MPLPLVIINETKLMTWCGIYHKNYNVYTNKYREE